MPETIHPTAALANFMENENGARIGFDVALYPSVGGQPAFVIVQAKGRTSDAHHTWTRLEAEHLRDMLNKVLPL